MNIRLLVFSFVGGLAVLVAAKLSCRDHQGSLDLGKTEPASNQISDKILVNVNVEDLTKIEWASAEGPKQVLSKEDGLWHYAGMEALDTLAINIYLQTLVTITGEEFSDFHSPADLKEVEKLSLYGNNMLETTVVTVYESAGKHNPFLIHSTTYPDEIFLSDSSGIYSQIFLNLRQFWP